MRVFDAACASCGETLQHPVWSPWLAIRRQIRRAVRAAVITLVLAGVPVAFVLHRLVKRSTVEPWKIGARMDALATNEPPDWQQVRVLARQLVDLRPSSEEGWYMLALSGRRLGYHPRLAIREALEALRIAPGMGQARFFVAAELAGIGEYSEARVHAKRALEWSLAPPEAWWLAGELELQRARPDIERALGYFEAARSRGFESVELDVRAAMLRQRLVGVAAPERYPPELTVALRRARASLERAPRDAFPPGLAEWFAAELELAEGRIQEAENHWERGLLLTESPEAEPLVRARLLTTKGRAEMARRRVDAAAAAFAEALRVTTEPEIVGTVVDVLLGAGRADALRDVLSAVPPDADSAGVVRAALAESERRAGRLDEALRLARAAVAAAPDTREWLILLGDVLRDRGDADGAEAAYARSAALGGDTLPGRISSLLLRLERSPDAAADVVSELQALRAEQRDDPELDAALGRALLAARRADDAALAFQRVVRAMPWSAGAWLDLAEAWRLSHVADAAERSATCAREAVRMRPFDRSVVLAAARAMGRNSDDGDIVLAAGVYLERNPGDADVLRARADARARLGEWSSAAEDLLAVAALGADDLIARLQLADALIRSGREPAAWELAENARSDAERRALEVVLASHSAQPPPGVELASATARAVALTREGELAQALEVLRTACAQSPGDPSLVRAIVLLLCSTEIPGTTRDSRLTEARDALGSLGDAGGPGLRAFLVGRIALAADDGPAAEAALREATEALPWDPSVHFFLAEALVALDAPGARDAYVRALWLPGGRAAFGDAIAARLLMLAERAEPGTRELLLRQSLRADGRLVPAARALFDVLCGRSAFREAADVVDRALALGVADETLSVGVQIDLHKRALAARMETGEAERASGHLDALERLGGDVERRATVRGLVALRRDRPESAEPLFREALERDAGDRLAALGLAESLVRQGSIDAALAFVQTRLAANPGELPLGHVVTRSLVRRGRIEAAVRVSADLVARAPLDTESVRQHVWALGLAGRADEALQAASEAAAVARSSDDASVVARASVFDVLRAESLLQLSDQADAALEEARRVARNPTSTEQARRWARMVEAESLVRLGRTEDADDVVRWLTAGWADGEPVTPDDAALEPRVRFVSGMVAFQRGRISEASAAFVRAVQLDPALHAAANNAAWCIAQTDAASPAALDMARRATALQPRAATYWDTRALCERGAGLWDEALSSWRKADELFVAASAPASERAAVLLGTAELLLDLGRGDEARDVARRLLAIAPDDPSAARARAIAERD